MKSRKFKAVLAAVSAIAVLATAMTGFAATIKTETAYNVGNLDKATVKTIVEGLNNKTAEVTLLVNTVLGAGVGGSTIAYIDQKTASDGQAIFEYQLDKTALSDATQATVISGNTYGEPVEDVAGNDGLNVKKLDAVSSDGYTIIYEESAYGNKDSVVHATVAVTAANKEFDYVMVGSNKIVTTTFEVPVADINNVSVVLKDSVITPKLTVAPQKTEVVGENTKISTLIQIIGEPEEVGVIYGDYAYKAINENNSQYVAVSLNAKTGAINANKIKAYYKADGVTHIVED